MKKSLVIVLVFAMLIFSSSCGNSSKRTIDNYESHLANFERASLEHDLLESVSETSNAIGLPSDLLSEQNGWQVDQSIRSKQITYFSNPLLVIVTSDPTNQNRIRTIAYTLPSMSSQDFIEIMTKTEQKIGPPSKTTLNFENASLDSIKDTVKSEQEIQEYYCFWEESSENTYGNFSLSYYLAPGGDTFTLSIQ